MVFLFLKIIPSQLSLHNYPSTQIIIEMILFWGLLLFLIFLVVALAILLIADCDLLTFFYSKVGKAPAQAFQDKVIWITGASSGIGEGIAKELSKNCSTSKIVLSARGKQELNRVKAECLELNPEREPRTILVIPFDMTEYSSHSVALEKILETFGSLNILISNAGRSQRAKWQEIEEQVDKELFNINVFSLVNLNRVVLRYFLSQQHPSPSQLVTMSSIAGKIGFPDSASYTASKFSLHGYFECLRNELRASHPHISITIICPGPVFSKVLREAFTCRVGEKVGQDHNPSDDRMTPRQCGYLSLVAIANHLEESWISPCPHILLVYLSAYQPYIFSKALQFAGNHGLFAKLRDNRKIIVDKKV